jgi:hypothetical protein
MIIYHHDKLYYYNSNKSPKTHFKYVIKQRILLLKKIHFGFPNTLLFIGIKNVRFSSSKNYFLLLLVITIIC